MNDNDKDFPLGDDGDFGRGLDVIFGSVGLIFKLFVGVWVCIILSFPVLVLSMIVLSVFGSSPAEQSEQSLVLFSMIVSAILLVLYTRRRGRY
jgi:ABC-type dipeptide/oligopeptide/nickel transport system permease subunit